MNGLLACGKRVSAHSHRRTAANASENVVAVLPGHSTASIAAVSGGAGSGPAANASWHRPSSSKIRLITSVSVRMRRRKMDDGPDRSSRESA